LNAEGHFGEPIWISEWTPIPINSAQYEELRIRDRALVLLDWFEAESVFVEREEVFGDGPARALVLRSERQQGTLVLIGEQGSELFRLNLDPPAWSRVAEMPRISNDTGGMRHIEALPLGEMILLHWELGALALDGMLELVWRHDLDWNHRLIHTDDQELWFDMLYESRELPQRIGERPYGFSMIDGRQLFDRNPPTGSS